MKLYHLLLPVAIITSCNARPSEQNGKSMNSIDTSLANSFADNAAIRQVVSSLEKNGYHIPDNDLFKKRIKAVFAINLDDSSKNDVILQLTQMAKDEAYDFPLAIRNGRFVVNGDGVDYVTTQPAQIDSSTYNPGIRNLVALNKLLIYNDNSQIGLVKNKFPELFNDLVVEYGYTGNDSITRIYLDSVSESEDGVERFASAVYGWYVNDAGKRVVGVRKNVLDKIIALKPGLMVHVGQMLRNLKAEQSGEGKNTPENRQEYLRSVATLLDGSLRAEIPGFSEELYDLDDATKKALADNHFFGYKALEDYTNKQYQSEKQREQQRNDNGDYFLLHDDVTTKNIARSKTGVINDPDGFTNIRSGSNSKAPVIGKIVDKEKFHYWTLNADWWVVQTNKGLRGFVHKSRIKEAKQ
ncbi:SH3 domain-containing protein [Chitinophaga vietnamensis]|uniref:SH3 domain-containing protein n=1 Tax=Chitinophaga vietnamensis TaxID=2593957 RepID=UPI0013760F0C|nr:SH3 domain-containing protein [Chitinophaga vietnamensis]